MTFIQSIEFRPIEISDREWLEPLLQAGGRESLEYSFSTNFLWQKIYDLQISKNLGYQIQISDMSHPAYLFPSGTGPLEPVLRVIDADARSRGASLFFHTVLEADKALLEEMYPGRFLFTFERDACDYVYKTQNLITLSGRKLSSKRNHINYFKTNHASWQYEPLTMDNIDEAHVMSDEWCKESGCRDNDSLYSESCAVEQAFKYFFDLRLDGGLLRADGRAVAFSMGEALSEDTYIVHIEKAFTGVRGAYPMINQQFAEHNCQNFQYINREDDSGDPGLRQAKLSYDPVLIVPKYTAKLIGDDPL